MAFRISYRFIGRAPIPIGVTWQDPKSFATIHARVAAGTELGDLPQQIASPQELHGMAGVSRPWSRTKHQPHPVVAAQAVLSLRPERPSRKAR